MRVPRRKPFPYFEEELFNDKDFIESQRFLNLFLFDLILIFFSKWKAPKRLEVGSGNDRALQRRSGE